MVAKPDHRLPGKPIRRAKSLAALVAERLKRSIFTTEIRLGEVLSEEKIAAAMRVSRTPVREALTLLQLQGLITIVPQRGSIVFRPDADDIKALVQYRLMLEMQAAPMAMKHAPLHAVAQLDKAVAAMSVARETEDALAYADADGLFHSAFFEHCGNRYVREGYEVCANRISALRAHLSRPLEMFRSRTHTEHVDIAAAFARNDVDALLEILHVHISDMEGNYIRALGDL
jgi:DNA-binding GntR family transcriptional regulator